MWHILLKYTQISLKDARPRVKAFYLSLLGQLILSSSINRAEEILKGILIIARSETEGMTINNEKTICEIYKIKIKNLLTSSNEEIPIDDNLQQSDNDPFMMMMKIATIINGVNGQKILITKYNKRSLIMKVIVKMHITCQHLLSVF